MSHVNWVGAQLYLGSLYRISCHLDTGRDWSAVTRWDELFADGSVTEALSYARLLWPEFLEAEGMVFLREEVEVQPALHDVPATLRTFASRTDMERAFNLIEVPTLFATGVEASDEELTQLAATLRDAWQAKLEQEFPGRPFVVEILGGEVDDPTVRFFEVRRPPQPE